MGQFLAAVALILFTGFLISNPVLFALLATAIAIRAHNAKD